MPRHFVSLSSSSPVQVRGRVWVSPIEGVGMVVVGRSTAATRVVLWEGASATGCFRQWTRLVRV